MFIHPDISFVHIPKCGGSTAKYYLSHATGTPLEENPHRPLPADMRDGFVITTMRDPFSWYLSWWSHVCMTDGRHYKKWDNHPFWRNKWSDIQDPLQFRAFVKAAVDSIDLDQAYWRFRFFNQGLLTRRLLHLCTGDQVELLRGKWIGDSYVDVNELEEFWYQNSYVNEVIDIHNETDRVKELVKERIEDPRPAEIPHRNVTAKLTCEEAYDEETVDLVRGREELIFRLFGYERRPRWHSQS